MRYPYVNEVAQAKEITTYFNGLDHRLTCREGSFYNLKNVTTEEYPVLSTRHKRTKGITFTNFNGIMDKDVLVWVDGTTLYVDGDAKQLASGVTLTNSRKTLCKMGAYVVIFPDKVWFNVSDGTSGWMEASKTISGTSISFQLAGADGTAITYHDETYYETHVPQNGDYKMTNANGKSALYVYSKQTNMWSGVPTVYVKISASGIDSNFAKDDGVKITVTLNGASWSGIENFLPTDEGNGKRSGNFIISDKGSGYVVVPGIINENKTFTTIRTDVSRPVPDLAFVTECMNRLWGCSTDGHEIYCSKQGDVSNWNYFAGTAIDSWAATVGSDGKFTGAVTYLGTPIFFKEESLLRITPSSYGAHSYKELTCRGVQEDSSESLVMMDELLYYKGVSDVCVYDGNFPSTISEPLGDGKYSDALAGGVRGRYYLNVKDSNDAWHLFVFDAKNGLWSEEDDVHVNAFVRHDDDLLFVTDGRLVSAYGSHPYSQGTDEGKFEWTAETGSIGYASTDKKYVSRFAIRMKLEVGSHVALFIEYDSSDKWEYVFDMSGKGTKTFAIPVRPKRCDHFRIRLVGYGDAKLFAITKTTEEGSDV